MKPDEIRRFPQIGGGLGPITAALVHELLQHDEPGTVLTDAHLGQACGCDLSQPNRRNYVYRAIRYVERTKGRCWQRVRGENAITLLTDSGIVERGKKRVTFVRRHSKRTVLQLSTVDPDKLPESERAECRALVAQNGAIHAFSQRRVREKLAEGEPPQAPDVNALAAAFSKRRQAPD